MKTCSLPAVDRINQRLDQLSALLAVAQSDSFTHYTPRVQINYLWTCYSLVEEIRATFNQPAEPAQEVVV